jgi:transcription initiation factor IIF auxiliary subunit
MDYQIKQSSKKDSSKENYWNWSVWIDSSKENLNKIDYVEYILHPSFPNRIKKRTSIKNKFLLKSKGWGEFNINVRVYFKDNEKNTLNLLHYLKLFNEENIDSKKLKNIFISSQFKDKQEVEELKNGLTTKNIEVNTANNIELIKGSDITNSIFTAIENSDTYILYGHNNMSRFQMHELEIAKSSNKEIIIIDEDQSYDNPNLRNIKAKIFKTTDDYLNEF